MNGFDVLRAPERRPELGRGTPNESARDRLSALSVNGFVDPIAAQAAIAGLWLLHDFLDESHAISQTLATSEGAYWHGMMHRREGDYWNAKYWFRKAGEHPFFEAFDDDLTELGWPLQGAWRPESFVDLIEECLAGRSPHAELCRELQRREWDRLFECCMAAAQGR